MEPGPCKTGGSSGYEAQQEWINDFVCLVSIEDRMAPALSAISAVVRFTTSSRPSCPPRGIRTDYSPSSGFAVFIIYRLNLLKTLYLILPIFSLACPI